MIYKHRTLVLFSDEYAPWAENCIVLYETKHAVICLDVSEIGILHRRVAIITNKIIKGLLTNEKS